MPVYLYKPVGEGCEHCAGGLEVFQRIDEPPLAECPRCGQHLQRVPASFSAGKGDVLSPGHLKEHGFSKLRRRDDGTYQKEL